MRTLLPGDNPQAYIPGDRRRALARGEELPLRAHGAATLRRHLRLHTADRGPRPRARRPSRRRGAVGHPRPDLRRPAGAAARAGTAASSTSAATPSPRGSTATTGSAPRPCALAMQEVMARVGVVRRRAVFRSCSGSRSLSRSARCTASWSATPASSSSTCSPVRLMDSLAAAEQQCRSRARSCWTPGRWPPSATGSSWDPGADARGRRGRRRPGRPPVPRRRPDRGRELPDDVARQWLLPPVWDRMVAGRGEFLADLRPAVPIFVRFGGLDFEADPQAPTVLDAFVTRAQRALDDQGGSVLQLTIGDKGAYLYGVFGAPHRPRGRRGPRLRGARCGCSRSPSEVPVHRRAGRVSRPAGCAAAPTVTRSGARSAASATRSTSRPG